jgi:hypothetical protein
MKKIILVVIAAIVAAVYFFSRDTHPEKLEHGNPHFVTIKDGKFFLENKPFYPVAVNYMVSLQADSVQMWPSSFRGYGDHSYFNHTNRDSCLNELRAEMQMIRDMGFNSVRLVGIGEQKIENKQNGLLSLRAHLGNDRDTTFYLTGDKNYTKYFNALEDLFDAAGDAGLKVIFLARVFNEVPSTEEHLARILDHFQKDSVIMAWDLFNEPLYFDSLAREKKQVYEISKKWDRIVKEHAPYHLSTIGLTGVREVFEWDPNLLTFDFLSIHPYEYEPDQVRNEMFWYKNYIKLPWIVGETSIPADNDSVPYSDQVQFAERTMKRTYDCNGVGYSWWQYKDVEWFNFHANFMGVLSHYGDTVNSSGAHIIGKVKPVASVFKSYLPFGKKDSCDCLPNYYNYTQHTVFRLTGKLVDENGEPIEGGVILAWNKDWSSSYNTSTKADGTFELLGNFEFHHWIASATRYSVIRGDIDPSGSQTGKGGVPTMNMGELKIEKLDFGDL